MINLGTQFSANLRQHLLLANGEVFIHLCSLNLGESDIFDNFLLANTEKSSTKLLAYFMRAYFSGPGLRGRAQARSTSTLVNVSLPKEKYSDQQV